MPTGVPGRVIPLNSLLVESQRRDIATLDRVGGDPALDFANTLGGLREGPWDDEWLHDYADLVAWARHAGVLETDRAARALERHAAAHPRAAGAALTRALALREQIHAVFAALADGDDPPPAALAALEAAHRDALAHAALAPAGGRLDWAFARPDDDLDRPAGNAVIAAVDLLRSDRLARLKQCANCRWLFLDASKNASRRWCSMAHCGTGAKVAATRARRRAARA
jgi:predicted RNA-binding Zn ribbon-like protein